MTPAQAAAEKLTHHAAQNMPSAVAIKAVFAIPHFHFDLEWWKTQDEYAKDCVVILSRAVELLERYPEFTYVLDQAFSVKPFLEAHPEAKEKLRRYIQEGRVEVVGGTLAAPDENIPYGESLVRQFAHGKKFAKEVLGANVDVAWEIDEFGHPEQMPQILNKCGFKAFAFARGVQNWESDAQPLQFYWEGPDGSRILTHWFAGHYAGMSEAFPGQKASADSFFVEARERLQYEERKAVLPYLLFPFGTDFTVPDERWIEFVKSWNQKSQVKISFSLPCKYFKALEEGANSLPVQKGEFNPVFTGCYESRHKIKKLARLSQNSILETEKFASVASHFGKPYPEQELDAAWENILLNDFHDVVCGTGTDKVYQNTLKRYGQAISVTEKNKRDSLMWLGNHILTDPELPVLKGAKPCAVFNSLSWAREEVVSIPQMEPGAVVFDAMGNPVPCQETDSLLLFKANTPSFGYKVYYTASGAGNKEISGSRLKVTSDSMENETLRVELDPATGFIGSLVDKKQGRREVLNTRHFLGNEIIAEQDVGNLWTVQRTGKVFSGRKFKAEIVIEETGPLRAVLCVKAKHHGFERVQKIIMYAGKHLVEFQTRLHFHGKDMRVQALFSPHIHVKESVFESPYGVTGRGEGHWCMQNFADASDGSYGLGLLSVGTPGVELRDGALRLTLLRSVSLFIHRALPLLLKRWKDFNAKKKHAWSYQRRHINVFEWAMYDYHGLLMKEFASAGGPPSFGSGGIWSHIVPYLKWWQKSDAWEHGNHEFRYAIAPHQGNFAEGNLPRLGWELNNPLIPFPLAPQAGAGFKQRLPEEMSFLSVSSPNVCAAVLKKAEGEDSLVLRAYESHGVKTAYEGVFFRTLKKAEKISMTEDKTYLALDIKDGSFQDTLMPYEIATYKIQF